MIAMNPLSDDGTANTDSEIANGIADGTIVVEVVREFESDLAKLIASIEEAMLALEAFGAVVRTIYCKCWDEYILSIIYWTPVFVKRNKVRINRSLRTNQFRAGAPPMNRGRHFNRRVHWKRK